MLTKRYGIPIENISYEYIEQMSNRKKHERELEQIIKILESGELGYYPDLTEKARDKLRQINKNNNLMRTNPTPIETLENMNTEEANAIRQDLNNWCEQMKMKENPVKIKKTHQTNENENLNVRGHNKILELINESKKTQSKIKSCDYDSWDKYDPDVEIKKMEIELEKEKEKLRIGQEQETGEAQYYTEEEKRFYANSTRIKGNNAYQSGQYTEALEFYTESIQLHPTAVCYSNRAQVYIKLKQFESALVDCNKALQVDKTFTKAIYRKGICCDQLKQYKESLKCFELILKQYPENKVVLNYIDKLRETENLNKKVKLVLNENKENFGKNTPKIICIDEKKSEETSLESRKLVNEWGLSKNYCNCTGDPKFIRTYEQDRKSQRKDNMYCCNTQSETNKNKTLKLNKSFVETEKTNEEIKREVQNNEVLNRKASSIFNILGAKDTKEENSADLNIKLTFKDNKKCNQKPKIEILKSEDF